MGVFDLKLLDCTLRDGGYINDWDWGFDRAKAIIEALRRAKVDIIEVGFLRNVESYDQNITVCNHVEELNNLLPKENDTDVMYSAMAMRSNYDINKLSEYAGNGIEMIRVTAHDYDIDEGMKFAGEVKRKGYKLSINPINIMGYDDEKILWIIDKVNYIQPYQFSIVDTFGSMKRRDLDRIVSLVDNNLDKNIRIALHLHENMSLGCLLAQNFIDKHLNRPVAIDGSLMGIGRIPGNLPIELISDYLNEYIDKNYDLDYLMDAIQDYVSPLKGDGKWGYNPTYFLSARFNLHRNYAEYYLEKGDLTNRDINHILSRFDRSKCTVFDIEYAEKVYNEYRSNSIDDEKDLQALKEELAGRNILIIAPGYSIQEYKNEIHAFIERENPVLISVNFVPKDYPVQYCFFSNNKRYENVYKNGYRIIATSNLSKEKADFWIDYNRLSGSFNQGCNSYIMLLKLLKIFGYDMVFSAGADGYKRDGKNYCSTAMRNYSEFKPKFNYAVTEAIERVGISVHFITPSKYDNKNGGPDA